MSSQEELKKLKDNKRELINTSERRLHELKKKDAILGVGGDPSIPLQIQDIELELGKLRTELEEIETEEKISIALSLEVSRILVARASESRSQMLPEQQLDPLGIASVKSQLHALSEIVAQDAMKEAAVAAEEYPHDALTILVPLIVDLRWARGYESGLTRLLKVPPSQQFLRDFQCVEVSPPCPVMDGVLSAEQNGSDQVLIQLSGNPAILVSNLASTDIQAISDAVNDYGRLGMPSSEGLSLLERIGDIPIRSQTEDFSELAAALYRNRQALIPLVARLGMPGEELLLPDEEEFPPIGKPLLEDILQEKDSHGTRDWPELEQSQQEGIETKVFFASRAIKRPTSKKPDPEQEQLQQMLNSLMAKDPEKARKLIETLKSQKSKPR